MKINTSYFPSVIILLGVFIFISLFFGTGNVVPYSKVSNFSSFEGFDSSNLDNHTGEGVGELWNTATAAVSNAATNLFGSSNDPASGPVGPAVPAAQVDPASAPPVNPGGIEPFATLSGSANNYSSYN